jgi:general secretion pathway protein G
MRALVLLSVVFIACLSCSDSGAERTSYVQAQAQKEETLGRLIKVWDAVLLYRTNMGDYPSSEQGLNALLPQPQRPSPRWRGPYLDEQPVDVWDRPFLYHREGDVITIYSAGPDGEPGTADDIADKRDRMSLP